MNLILSILIKCKTWSSCIGSLTNIRNKHTFDYQIFVSCNVLVTSSYSSILALLGDCFAKTPTRIHCRPKKMVAQRCLYRTLVDNRCETTDFFTLAIRFPLSQRRVGPFPATFRPFPATVGNLPSAVGPLPPEGGPPYPWVGADGRLGASRPPPPD